MISRLLKFTYDSAKNSIEGSAGYIENAAPFVSNAETIFLFAKSLYKPESNKVSTIDLWQAIYSCDKEVHHLVSVALKIISGEYMLSSEEIVPTKPVRHGVGAMG